MFYKKLLALSLLLSLSLSISARDPNVKTESKNSTPIETLLKKADSVYYAGNHKGYDSLLNVALEQSSLSNNIETRLLVYENYFKHGHFSNRNKDIALAKGMIDLSNKIHSNEWLCKAYTALSNVYVFYNESIPASYNANKAIYYASLVKNESIKIKTLLTLAMAQELENNNLEAFRSYMNALYKIRETDDEDLEFDIYGLLSDFYRKSVSNYPKSKFYKIKQMDIVAAHSPVDSNKLMQLNTELELILFNNQEIELGEKIMRQVVAYALRKRNPELKDRAILYYRNYLSRNSDIPKLYKLYTADYPEELDKISRSDTVLYYRIKATLTEHDNNLDSANYYHNAAEQIILQGGYDNIYKSNFYRRYAQYHARTNNTEAAKTAFKTSLDFALQARYFPYLIEASDALEKIYVKENNYQLAYEYEKLHNNYNDSLNLSIKEGELLMLEIDNENKQQELQLQKQAAETERRHTLQFIAITLFILALFIIIVLLGYFHVPLWLIKIYGFFSFILLFEFIALLSEVWLAWFHHHEPWRVMLVKLIIVAILAPIHHWAEHKLIHYLHKHEPIGIFKGRIRKWLYKLFSKPTPRKQYIRTRKPDQQLPPGDSQNTA